MLGQTISHQRIIEQRDNCEMGAVYRAHDTGFDRDVAMKFLSRHLIASQSDRISLRLGILSLSSRIRSCSPSAWLEVKPEKYLVQWRIHTDT